MAKLEVVDLDGKSRESLELDSKVFDGKVSQSSMYQAVVSYLANQRQGSAATKTRGEVSGGGIKPWRQKGTGRARVGSTRNPLWRHGGVVFGPHPRNFHRFLPKKIRLLALKSSLNLRIKENELFLLEDFKLASPKTKEMVKILEKLKAQQNCLLVLNNLDENILKASRNIPKFQITSSKEVNAYDILKFRKLLITKGALTGILKRIK